MYEQTPLRKTDINQAYESAKQSNQNETHSTSQFVADVRMISLDWLQINLNDWTWTTFEDVREIVPGIHLEPTGWGDRAYKNVSQVYMDGEHIGLVKFDPHSEKIKPNGSASFKLLNNLLYTPHVLETVSQFITRTGSSYDCIKQIDVALDGYGFLEAPRHQFQGGTTLYRGRSFVDPKFKGRNLLQVNIGSRKSEIFARMYRKTDEIESSKKYYIREAWEQIGMNPDNVERLEFSLQQRRLDRLGFARTWEAFVRMLQPENLAGIAKHCFDSVCCFVDESTGHGNISRAKRCFSLAFNQTVSLLTKARAVASSKVRSVQTAVKNLIQFGLMTGADYFEKVAREMVVSCDLVKWYHRKLPDWEAEHERCKRHDRKLIPAYVQYASGQQLNLFKR